MDTSLEGKVAIVTGGSRGIGRAIAAALLQKGAHVAISGVNKDHLEKAEAELSRVGTAGARVLIFSADVRDHLAVQSLVDETARRQGGIDILVNNAGVGWFGSLESQGHDDWRRVMDTNVTGMVIACQVFYAALKASKHGGRVINIASLSSYVSLNEVAAYAASKSAVLSLTKSLAIEWSKEGINVNAIAPGVFRTDLNAGLLDGTDRGREFLLRTPMKRFGKPEELVGAAVLLASGSASFITGQCIAVDGGFLCSGVNS